MRLHWLLPNRKGIPVLMYHRVLPGVRDGLTVTPEDLREHLQYMIANGYQALSMPRFIKLTKGGAARPDKAFLLTFDDGYADNLAHAYPILKELGLHATVFVIGDTLDGTSTENPDPGYRKMTLEELKQIDPSLVQIGMHGYHHESFGSLDEEGLESAIVSMKEAFRKSGLTYCNAFAYPYGSRPKDAALQVKMKELLVKNGIEVAFRIGNRPANLPAKDPFEIFRIDVRGDETFEDFKIRLRKGKLKPF
jgi:peptidoglycan/xylan/chitin deacetylase (PgdA/CDA1 family)